jgi:hypothetical protein
MVMGLIWLSLRTFNWRLLHGHDVATGGQGGRGQQTLGKRESGRCPVVDKNNSAYAHTALSTEREHGVWAVLAGEGGL